MGEPNQTVDPFLSAGIRLPTQGIGYDGVDELTVPSFSLDLTLTPFLPRNVAGDPIAVVIPIAAVGDIIEVDATGTLASDLTAVTPATFATIGCAFQDSSTVPIVNSIANCSNFSPLDNSVNNYDTIYQQRNAVLVPATWVFPVTVFIVAVGDGSALLYTNSNAGFSSFILKVKRYPIGRSIGLPTAILQ
jgi:hypothetical protein